MASFPSGPAPVLPAFLRLSVANIISNLMVPLAGLIDTAFLGHLAQIHHLAGVALATVVFNMVYWSFGFLRMGTTGTVAQAQGRRDDNQVWLIGLRNSLIALALSLGVLLLQVPLRELGFSLLSAEPAVREAGYAFYNARIWGAPAVLLNLVLMGWFLGQQQGRAVILLSLVGNGANVALDYVFIRHLGWASAGAGAATALSQYLMLGVGLVLVARRGGRQRLRVALPQVWDPPALRAVFRLNRDIMIRTFAMITSFSLFTLFSAPLGTQIVAANALMLQVLTLSANFIDGIAFATESFAGRFYSSGQHHQLRGLLRLGGGTSVALGLAFSLTFCLFPQNLFGLLTSHGDVIATVRHQVWWLVPTLSVGGIAYMLDGYFLGLTAGRILRNGAVLAAAVGFLPLALVGRYVESPQVLWAAMACFMLARVITLGWAVPGTLRSPQPKAVGGL